MENDFDDSLSESDDDDDDEDYDEIEEEEEEEDINSHRIVCIQSGQKENLEWDNKI